MSKFEVGMRVKNTKNPIIHGRVLCIDRKNRDAKPVVIAAYDSNDDTEYLTCVAEDTDNWSPCTPWDDFKKDDPVLAEFEYGIDEYRRHFAFVRNGKPFVHPEGLSAFTSSGRPPVICKSVRRPTPEELGGYNHDPH